MKQTVHDNFQESTFIICGRGKTSPRIHTQASFSHPWKGVLPLAGSGTPLTANVLSAAFSVWAILFPVFPYTAGCWVQHKVDRKQSFNLERRKRAWCLIPLPPLLHFSLGTLVFTEYLSKLHSKSCFSKEVVQDESLRSPHVASGLTLKSGIRLWMRREDFFFCPGDFEYFSVSSIFLLKMRLWKADVQ